ncbi:uncharacterized protein [Amphiura filiformis]|uniref:uncharacterized protein n=1 Tax=Amphiura filiformis TaxID=82378 RepID=UPI003B21BF27
MLVPSTSALLFLVALTSLVHCRRDDFIIACGRNGVDHDIYWAPINSEKFTRVPIQNVGIPEDVTYDPIDDKIYWIETTHRQLTSAKLGGSLDNGADKSCSRTSNIFRVGLEGGSPELHVTHVGEFESHDCHSAPAKIAIDVESRQIFWVSGGDKYGAIHLLKTNIDSTKTISITITEEKEIIDLFVDSQNRKIYWAPSSSNLVSIERMDTDGTNPEIIIDLLLWVSGIAFDSKGNRIFLTNSYGHKIIQTIDLEDRSVDDFHDDPAGLYASNPALSDTHIYWIMSDSDSSEDNLSSRHMFKMPLQGGDQAHVKLNTEFHLDCLHIHRNEEPSDHADPNSPVGTGETTPSSLTPSTTHGPIKGHSISDKTNRIFFGTRLRQILTFTGFGLLLLLVVCLTCIMIVVLKKRTKCREPYGAIDNTHGDVPDEDVEQGLNNNDIIDNAFLEKEIDRDRLEVVQLLGSGCYGVVYQANLTLPDDEATTCVALKTLKDDVIPDVKERFLEEIKLHIEIGSHPNVLSVLGCVTISDPYCMIMKFMKYGDLQKFLWKCNKEENITKDRIYDLTELNQLHIARQIAQGMEYLSTTRYYHGDLAARNILVGEDLLIKISDFGMADDIYTQGYKRIAPEKKRPVKWVSLETNVRGQCTIKSDIWSYGIVLYEIYTLGGTPYPGMTCREVILRLQEGYRMEKSETCPDEIYEIMCQCWLENPIDRPTFTVLLRTLGQLIWKVTKDRPYQNVCEIDSNRPISDISNDDAFMPPYVKITDESNEPIDAQKESKESRGRVRSGEPDEHNLWKHLTKEKKTSSSSVEFVPSMADEEAQARIVYV